MDYITQKKTKKSMYINFFPYGWVFYSVKDGHLNQQEHTNNNNNHTTSKYKFRFLVLSKPLLISVTLDLFAIKLRSRNCLSFIISSIIASITTKSCVGLLCFYNQKRKRKRKKKTISYPRTWKSKESISVVSCKLRYPNEVSQSKVQKLKLEGQSLGQFENRY